MPPLKKLLFSVTASIALISVSAAPALADRNWHRGGGVYAHGFKQGVRGGHFNNRVNNVRIVNNTFNQRRFNQFNQFNQFDRRGRVFRGHPNRFHRNRGIGGAGAAAIGVGAGLLGLALINNAGRNRAPNTVIVREQVVVPPPQVVGIPQPAYNPNLPPAGQFGSCLQTREYQTTVIIGGAPREAYGTACLQPDGSWLQGPAVAVP